MKSFQVSNSGSKADKRLQKSFHFLKQAEVTD